MDKKEFEKLSDQEKFNTILEGEAYFAFLGNPYKPKDNKFNAPPTFKVSLALDKKNEKLAKSYGLKVREANDSIPKPFVELKRKVRDGKTEDECRPIVVDPKQVEFPKEILIGNGSKIICKFGRYWYENNGGGVGNTLLKVMVTDLVPYEKGSDMGDVDSDFSIEEFLQEKGKAEPVKEEKTPEQNLENIFEDDDLPI